ncbi:MAG: glycosyltransferase [Oscillospiraceae bacterium]|jgi:glycosyltransferase involved in cell wall biosynthesis|nr:glycosyltransferase [Oscillospiraceae bacterium]
MKKNANQKPRLLFVIPSLAGGGAEKSLIALLCVLGEKHGGGVLFDADLFLFERVGLFLDQIPPWVRVIDAGEAFARFTGSAKAAVLYFLRRGRLDLVWHRLRYGFAAHAPEGKIALRYWQALRHVFRPRKTQYAAAIGYLEGYTNYFIVDCVKAVRKIAYFHNDYAHYPTLRAADERYFARADDIVTVSESTKSVLCAHFPNYAEKFVCIENIVSPSLLRQNAALEAAPFTSANKPAILTIGRVNAAKGIDLAVCAAGILKRAGVSFCWYHIGRGKLENEIRALIAEENVADCFVLLGEQKNPYPALAVCDVYVQPSRYEGKCIAIEEAKALARPIVCTNFDTVASQIAHGSTGLIAKINPESIAEAVRCLLKNPAVAQSLSNNLRNCAGNEDQAEKFLQLTNIFASI